MEDKNLSVKLQELAKGTNRPATARIRERFAEIEIALKAGVSRRQVYEALIEYGIEIKFESFELTIYRLRKEKSGEKPTPASSTVVLGHDPPPKPAADALARPPGITPAAWTEMQQKHKAELRRQRNLRNGETK